MWNGVSNLGTPTGIAVGDEVVLSAFLRRDGISESFNIGGVRLTEIHVDGLLVAGRERYVIIMRGVDVL